MPKGLAFAALGRVYPGLVFKSTRIALGEKDLIGELAYQVEPTTSIELMSLPLMKFLQMDVSEWLITSETYWVQ